MRINIQQHSQEDASNQNTVSDEALVARVIIDKEQFVSLIERYEQPLLRYLYRCGVATKEDREDILQNVFMNVYRNIHQFDAKLAFSSWIYRITHNEAMTFFRRKKARPEIRLDAKQESWLSMVRDENADAGCVAQERLSSEMVSRALDQLEKSYRDVLVLRFFEERSYREISDILTMPMGTVSTTVHRAKRALATHLARYRINEA